MYHYSGILKALHNTLTQLFENVADGFTFKLQINIDGLPLFKSTIKMVSVPMKEPVVTGLFCGTKKPNAPDECLRDFTRKEGFH